MNAAVQKRETGEVLGNVVPSLRGGAGHETANRSGGKLVQFSGSGLEPELIRGADAIYGLETEWRELESHCSDILLFQSYDWCANWLSMSEENPGADIPVIAVWRKQGRLVGLLPLKIKKLRGMKVLTGLAEPFQQYTEMLSADGIPAEAFSEGFTEFVRKSGADYLHLGQVREGSMLAKVVHGKAKPTGEVEHAPYVPLSDWPDFDSYYKSVKSKTRKNMRNAVNRLERSGELAHEVAASGPLVRDVIHRTFTGRLAWLERKGITSRAFRDGEFEQFVERFAAGSVKGVDLLAMSLTHDGKPIADQWGFVYKGRYYAFMSALDTDYEQASPGKLHLGEVIKVCYEKGFRVADFMIPAMPYKMTWTENKVAVTDYTLAVSIPGRVYCDLWIGQLRPFAKKVWLRLPVGLRNVLANLLF